jgi:hypothetical protein
MVEINKFKLGNRFCRKDAKNGESCTFITEELNTKEVTYLKDLCAEKDFKLSVVELIDLNCLLICIYRSPNTDIQNFIDKLEIVLEEVQQRRRKLVTCGDWNINSLNVNNHVQELQSLLLSHNLINAVTSSTRITNSSASLIDVMIINKQYNEHISELWNLGYSDHLAQVLKVSVDVPNYIPDEIITRFSKYKVAKFNDTLNSELREGIYSANNLNESYYLFLNRCLGYFRRAFPMKMKKVDKNSN